MHGPTVFEYEWRQYGIEPAHWGLCFQLMCSPATKQYHLCVCFSHPLFTPLVRDSYPKIIVKAEHMTPDTGQLRPTEIYKSQVLTAGRRIPHAVQGHRRVAFGNRVNNQELWQAGFIATIGCVLSGFHRRVWLACLNYSAGHQGTEIATPGEAKAAPGLFDKESCLARGTFPWGRVGRGTCTQAI